jgi:hypothetical protein
MKSYAAGRLDGAVRDGLALTAAEIATAPSAMTGKILPC